MPRKPGEKNLSTDVDPELYNQFQNWLRRHKEPAQRQCLTAGLELFLALPDAVQGMLLVCDRHTEIFKKIAAVASEMVMVSLQVVRPANIRSPAEPFSENQDVAPPLSPKQLEKMARRLVDPAIVAGKKRAARQRDTKAKGG